jgi:hypothetical protein
MHLTRNWGEDGMEVGRTLTPKQVVLVRKSATFINQLSYTCPPKQLVLV